MDEGTVRIELKNLLEELTLASSNVEADHPGVGEFILPCTAGLIARRESFFQWISYAIAIH